MGVDVETAGSEPALSAAEPVAWINQQELRYLEMVSGNSGWGNHLRSVTLGGEEEGRSPLYAKPPAPSVAVKALEWRGPTPESNGCHVAKTIFGTYSAVNEDGWYVTLDDHPWGQGFEWSAPDMRMTFDDAAKAAQSDYEARIRSALSAQVQDVAGPVAYLRPCKITTMKDEFESLTISEQDHPKAFPVYASTPSPSVAVAEIVSKHGDPEAFGERELVALVDIQKFPYRTKLYAAAPAKQEGGNVTS